MIKKFENFIDSTDTIYVYREVVIKKSSNRETIGFDMSYVESGCDKYIGEGFYEKVLDHAKYIYGILEYLKPIMGLLEGFADMRFADITKKDKDLNVDLYAGISTARKGNGKYNGFRYNRNLTIESIICSIIYDFISNVSLGHNSLEIRTTTEQIEVNDPKYNILNMPDNKDLYPNLNIETIKYIKNYDINKEFVPSIRLSVGVSWEAFRSVNIDISECDKAFDEFLKIFNHLVKKNSVIVKETTNKYNNPTTTEYRVLIIF